VCAAVCAICWGLAVMAGDVGLFQPLIPRVEGPLSDRRGEEVMGERCLQSKCATNCAMAPVSRGPIPRERPGRPTMVRHGDWPHNR
jgi:hypothetical protein